MNPIKSYVGIAKVVTASAVKAKLGSKKYDNGAIFVTCPEAGFTASNMLYCRYGLSLPYVKVQIGQTVWIEPTVHDNERWKYTGFADCPFEPAADDLLLLGDLDLNLYLRMKTTGVYKWKNATLSHNQMTHIHQTPTGPSDKPTENV